MVHGPYWPGPYPSTSCCPLLIDLSIDIILSYHNHYFVHALYFIYHYDLFNVNIHLICVNSPLPLPILGLCLLAI